MWVHLGAVGGLEPGRRRRSVVPGTKRPTRAQIEDGSKRIGEDMVSLIPKYGKTVDDPPMVIIRASNLISLKKAVLMLFCMEGKSTLPSCYTQESKLDGHIKQALRMRTSAQDSKRSLESTLNGGASSSSKPPGWKR